MSIHTAFTDAAAVAAYADGPPRMVPGFADMQRMCLLLMAENAPPDARILVLGAGGGLELEVFANAQPQWQFDGVDPSAEMLQLAHTRLHAHAQRVRMHQGTIDIAPAGPFDAACCLLTLHFLAREERRRTLSQVRRRLKPGAPFVAAHFSFPQDNEAVRARWLARCTAFAMSSGIAPDKARAREKGLGAQLPILSPEDDEALLREAGFSGVELFYAALGFRGWVSTA
ncbi:MAG: class I SAM-dependent methyltransferase [Polaromonas sp.]|nr:class I SAM-dependent methyltransferase [Polaromonas sp.]